MRLKLNRDRFVMANKGTPIHCEDDFRSNGRISSPYFSIIAFLRLRCHSAAFEKLEAEDLDDTAPSSSISVEATKREDFVRKNVLVCKWFVTVDGGWIGTVWKALHVFDKQHIIQRRKIFGQTLPNTCGTPWRLLNSSIVVESP